MGLVRAGARQETTPRINVRRSDVATPSIEAYTFPAPVFAPYDMPSRIESPTLVGTKEFHISGDKQVPCQLEFAWLGGRHFFVTSEGEEVGKDVVHCGLGHYTIKVSAQWDLQGLEEATGVGQHDVILAMNEHHGNPRDYYPFITPGNHVIELVLKGESENAPSLNIRRETTLLYEIMLRTGSKPTRTAPFTKRYNCHGQTYWPVYSHAVADLCFVDNPESPYFLKMFYRPLQLTEELQPGDVVAYINLAGDGLPYIGHTATVSSVVRGDVIVNSKWSGSGAFQGTIVHVPFNYLNGQLNDIALGLLSPDSLPPPEDPPPGAHPSDAPRTASELRNTTYYRRKSSEELLSEFGDE